MGGKTVPKIFDGSPPRPRQIAEQPAVFLADVKALADLVNTGVLDEAEAKRAARFVRKEDRDRYIVGHVMVRLVLSEYLDLDPAALPLFTEKCPLCNGPHGRPAVQSEPRLHFSLSHGGGFAMAAFASSPIGVDVEPTPDSAAIADLLGCLNARERRSFDALDAAARPTAFAQTWVRKEAYLKARGTGLAVDPALVHGGLGEGPPPGTFDLEAPQGHAAAVAVIDD